jgi:hypothetical protein
MRFRNLAFVMLFVGTVSLTARAAGTTVVWRDPGPAETLNLFYGAGGQAHAPTAATTFTFIKEDAEATTPKFEVADQDGVEWKVKLGEETQPETAASRLMWAAGYFTDEDYYAGELTVTGLPRLQRGAKYMTNATTVHGARLERKVKGVERMGNWDWFDNPFLESRELNGLRIMMSLLNNWDLKEINNTILKIGDERRYVVTDLGATFGNTGNRLTRSKSEPVEYADSKFVDKVGPDAVDLILHSRPFVLSAINPPHYQTRTKMEDVAKNIPRADARWLAQRLAALSAAQIADAFRAGGYTPGEIAVYTQAVRKRIAELGAL